VRYSILPDCCGARVRAVDPRRHPTLRRRRETGGDGAPQRHDLIAKWLLVSTDISTVLKASTYGAQIINIDTNFSFSQSYMTRSMPR
jgi:hypothetical protein